MVTVLDTVATEIRAIPTPFDGKLALWESRLATASAAADAAKVCIGEIQPQLRAAQTARDSETADRCAAQMREALERFNGTEHAISQARAVLTELARLQYDWRAVRWVAGNGKGKSHEGR